MSYKSVGMALAFTYMISFNSAAQAQPGEEKNEPFMVDAKSGQKFFLKKPNSSSRSEKLTRQTQRPVKSQFTAESESRKSPAHGRKRLRPFSNYAMK